VIQFNTIGRFAMQESTPSTSRKSLYLKLLGVAAILILGVVGTLSMSSTKSAPDVTFTNLQGKEIPLASLRGKVVLVNFWATSCVTCIKEMPQMVETYERYHARGLDFVAIAMSYDPPNYVLNFTETRKLPFTVALDPQDKLAKAFGDVKLTPTTFLINKEGKIIKRYVGEPDFAALHQLLETALAG
jgi:peroxiredoxin